MLESEFNQRLQESPEGREYLKLIQEASSRTTIGGLTENHHIFPKGLGGSPKGKCVHLTVEEHGKAHELLAKIFGGKMLYAYSLMTRAGERNEELIEKAREQRGNFIKEHEIWKKSRETKGQAWVNAHTPEAEAKRRATKREKFGGEFAYLQTNEVKAKRKATLISHFGSIMGACHTEEAESKQREARKKTMLRKYGSTTAQLHTEEVKRKASESRKHFYEQRGTYATAHTHTPEAEAKRKEVRKLKNIVKASQEYSEWFESRKHLYYHKIDGVLDFLKEKNLTAQEYLREI